MRREIAVVGGGLSGYCAAIAFAARGFDTVLVAPPAPEDRRTTALIGQTVDFLAEIGVWTKLAGKTQPLRTLRIVDDTRRLLRAPTVEFRAGEIDRADFGASAENRDIMSALRERASELASVLHIIESPLRSLETMRDGVRLALEDRTEVLASLAVGADGRGSRVREEAGIALRRWSYTQSALVLNFRHERDHEGVSTEFHKATGPFTQVPLPGRRSSLVWVEEPDIAALTADLKPDRLAVRIEDQMHSILGKIEVEDGIQSFPLSGGAADRLTGERVALVGEAAHFIPPIGAQGLNLGLRDAQAVVASASAHRDDPGGGDALASYASARRLDVASRSGGVDLLNRSLLTSLLPVQFGRAAGLGALSAIGPLRRFAMREGISPGEGVRELGRRLRDGFRRESRP